MERVKLKEKKPNAGHFTKGHKKSVGPRNTEFRKVRRFISAAIEDALTTVNPKTKRAKIQDIVDKMVHHLEDKPDVFSVAKLTELIEGKPMQAVELTGKEGKPITLITANMTQEEAARAYADMLNKDS